MTACSKNAHARATFFDLPNVEIFASTYIFDRALASRIVFKTDDSSDTVAMFFVSGVNQRYSKGEEDRLTSGGRL